MHSQGFSISTTSRIVRNVKNVGAQVLCSRWVEPQSLSLSEISRVCVRECVRVYVCVCISLPWSKPSLESAFRPFHPCLLALRPLSQ